MNKLTETKQKLIQEIKEKNFIHYPSGWELKTPVTNGGVDYLIGDIEKALDTIQKETIREIRMWCIRHANYDENSDLDPSPEMVLNAREIIIYLTQLSEPEKEE